MEILLVGGGSGGHIFPLFSIAKELEKHVNASDLHFIIADNDSDYRYFTNTPYQYSVFSVAKLRRYFTISSIFQNIRDIFRLTHNTIKALWFLHNNKPKKIVSKGGFVSLPFGIAAYVFKTPLYLHETDSSMGLSNRLLSKVATKVFTGFPSHNPSYIFTGNPVRKEFFEIEKVNHCPKNKIINILVFGGSQGAQALNTWTRTFFKDRDNTNVLLLTGKGKLEKNKNDAINTSNNIKEVEFLRDGFVDAISNADIVITRAGGSICELAAAKKCTVLVPLPSAANNHQRKNAQYFSKQNAAVYIEEENLYSDTTKIIINDLIHDPKKRAEYEKNIAKLGKPNAVKIIAEEILGAE